MNNPSQSGSTTQRSLSRSNVKETLLFGSLAGIVAWVLGYITTYTVISGDIRDTPLNQIIEVFEGEPATYEMVGWVFYNAHFVDTVFQNVPIIGSMTTNYIGGDDGFTVLLYLIPIAVLLLAGFTLGWYHWDTVEYRGALLGIVVLPAYLLLTIVGVFAFEVTLGDASGRPDLIPSVFLVGLVYPALFAGIGGVLGTLAQERAQ